MKRKTKYYIGIISVIILVFTGLLLYSKFEDVNTEVNNNIESIDQNKFLEDINKFSTWSVYWDLTDFEKLSQYNSKLKDLSYFEAYFNDEEKLEVPEKLIEYKEKTKEYEFNKYISITNDIIHENGSSSTKDKDILESILYNDDLVNENIEEIINIAQKYDFDGIEMDYENIKNDKILWERYIDFLKKLYDKCNCNNLKLRVVLEPNIPEDNLNFFEGPTYVIMCYNIHNLQTEPGEKTNINFINELIDKVNYIPGDKEFAIPNGGFDWAENNENSSSVTQSEAEGLYEKYNASVERDSTSGYLYFSYMDENNIKHEVWYADEKTLKEFIKVIEDKGYDVGIWRLTNN